ncbi:MAG: hypothetical protein GKR93_17500 [Gammaproteobacteria bacterium]|nr:hypothetical protein [Gammaproteobacteria bacterium]
MRTVLLSLIIVVLCQACNQQTRKPDTNAGNPEAQAQQLMTAGNHLAAAEEYTRLAETRPQLAPYYQLRTADNLFRANDAEQASEIIRQVQASRPVDIFYSDILHARFALAQGDSQGALSLLKQKPETKLPLDLLADWHESRAKAYELTLNFLIAVQERIELDTYLLDPLLRRNNIQTIWDDLNRIKLNVLQEIRSSTSLSMSAWIELSIINQTMLFKGDLLEQSLASWIEQYPQHIATPLITNEISKLSKQAVLQPDQIAILLPLSGQYEKASHAIREGILNAWYDNTDYRPKIKIYDANALNISTVYRQAVEEGADFVIGPLEKKAIEALMNDGELSTITLALNHADQTGPERSYTVTNKIPKLIQFGLSPEDEARQAAERAIFDGHNKALIITPNNTFGSRLAQAFSDTWINLGGKVLEHVGFEHRLRDYSTPVKQLLNIDSSQLRANKLRQKINRSMKSETRLREDADMIFMAAVPLSARQIVPQLKFHLASNIPVYSSSHAYSGVINRSADNDMNGIFFTDMPALLVDQRLASSVHIKLNDNWSADTSNFRRLYALGVDAYRLIPYIGKLSLQETAVYNGETGDLYIDKDGRIRRKLLWARFTNGRARLLPD